MSCASLAEAVVHAPSALVPASPSHDTDALGERIAALAARLHAATYELLVLLGQFDAGNGWTNGFLSCAHWLHWRTGIDLGAAREKVRVARALPALPAVSARMQRGQLSYAKARALTRVATPENEQSLVDFALAGTAAQVERFVRACRRVDRVAAEREAESRHLSRQLSTWVDDDGMVVIRGRLSPEVGAVVQRALEAAAERLWQDGRAAATGDAMAEEVTPAQRRADALGLLAETALSAGLDAGSAGGRYQLVVHVDAVAGVGEGVVLTAGGRAGLSAGQSEPPSAGDGRAPVGGALELDEGPVYVSAETSHRLACDASVVVMRHDGHGHVLDVGRRTRTIPPSIRRALAARDATCQFPGCTARRCDAHHLEHWADGGATSLGNLLLLCRRHHRAVHEGGFQVVAASDGGWAFHQPDGRLIPRAPDLSRPAPWQEEAAATAVTAELGAIPVWDGTPFDLVWAVDVLYANAAGGRVLGDAGAGPTPR